VFSSGSVASIIENEARLAFRHNYPAKAIILIATLSMAFTAQFAIASPADDFMNGFGDDFMDDAMKAVEKKIEESRAEESVPVEVFRHNYPAKAINCL
jgi:hypothetical protein